MKAIVETVAMNARLRLCHRVDASSTVLPVNVWGVRVNMRPTARKPVSASNAKTLSVNQTPSM